MGYPPRVSASVRIEGDSVHDALVDPECVKMPEDLCWLTISEVQSRVAAGLLDPLDVIRSLLRRIAAIDPSIHAYLHIERDPHAGSGPLAGVGLAVKDTQPVAGMPWTYGSQRWRNRIAEVDAIPVHRAKLQGATVLGKTNTPELAASIGTVNELCPPTQNPWHAGFTPGGSSGGSAAAVAAGLCTVASGDDMGGSIRIPSACCGIFGLRPTTGRIPNELPQPAQLGVRGPMARSVADLRQLFGVMAADTAAPISRPRLRIGAVDESPLGLDARCRAAVRRVGDALESCGHSVEALSWTPDRVIEAYRVVRPSSLANTPGNPADYGAAVGELIRKGRTITAAEYLAARADGELAARPLRDALEQGLGALLTPTLGQVPMPIGEVPSFLGDSYGQYVQFVLPVSFAGLPAISIPAGVVDGLPIAVQLIGLENQEWALLDLAEELEAIEGFGFQRPPVEKAHTSPSTG